LSNPITVPEDWSEDVINFSRNGSSWRCSNAIAELQEIIDAKTCLCGLVSFQYLREASLEDEAYKSSGKPCNH
jgi:hypothetical protein